MSKDKKKGHIPTYLPDEVIDSFCKVFVASAQAGAEELRQRQANGETVTEDEAQKSVARAITDAAGHLYDLRQEIKMLPYAAISEQQACLDVANAACKAFDAGYMLGAQAAVQQVQAEQQQDSRIILPN